MVGGSLRVLLLSPPLKLRKKRNLKKDFRFHDDITQSNLGLMARLKRSERFENVWFYNCNVYAKKHK
jgi:hypothetical protein